MKRLIYLDYNSTTKVSPAVLTKMQSAYELPLNNSSSHQLGRLANKLIEEARQNLKDLLNAQNYEVVFTSSATEASNTVIFGCEAEAILLSSIEHSSVFNCRPQNKKIFEIDALQSGLINLEDLNKKLSQNKNSLVSVMLANNETGAIQPVEEIAKITHQHGGLFHCDIVQAIGKIEVDLEKINADFASVSAHKINGPQGVGALLIRKGLEIKPLLYGGKQEKSKRAGTCNVAGISGFGEACKIAAINISSYQNIRQLRDFLESEIKKIAGDDVKFFADDVARLANTSFISLCNADSQTQLINFDLNGICVSAGAVCSSGSLSESRVLKAMSVSKEFLKGAIRVSLGLESTKDEIETFIATWKQFYQRKKNDS